MTSIRVNRKHGVNPSVELCWCCGGEKGLVLAGRLPGDREAPHRAVWNKEPCDACRAHMRLGVILIEVRDGSEGEPNPYRTGALAVVADDFIQRLVQPAELAASILQQRMCFVPAAAWTHLRLPRTQGEAEALGSRWIDDSTKGGA